MAGGRLADWYAEGQEVHPVWAGTVTEPKRLRTVAAVLLLLLFVCVAATVLLLLHLLLVFVFT